MNIHSTVFVSTNKVLSYVFVPDQLTLFWGICGPAHPCAVVQTKQINFQDDHPSEEHHAGLNATVGFRSHCQGKWQWLLLNGTLFWNEVKWVFNSFGGLFS